MYIYIYNLCFKEFLFVFISFLNVSVCGFVMLVDAFYFLPKPPYFLDKSGLKVEINKPPFLQSHLTFKLFKTLLFNSFFSKKSRKFYRTYMFNIQSQNAIIRKVIM